MTSVSIRFILVGGNGSTVKRGLYHVDDAVRIAEESMIHILQLSEDFCNKTPNKGDPKVDEIFDMVQWNIMRFAVKDELERAGN